ncbi:MAG: glycosyltransferase family 4 protein [Dysgonamonadaceae bacterium]|jgi:glycosyltransferase involved in cell wall biosynthesis|nr:glycosyltransferase family 4 protein [Dysgonamonadaceae bacterium]
MNICIITNGVLPVPAVNGGAVENLVQAILDRNEERKRLTITVLSVFTKTAVLSAKEYQYTRFVFVKTPGFVRFLDRTLFWVANRVLKKQNAFNFRYIFRRFYFIYRCYQCLVKTDFDKVILENHHSLFLLLKSKKLYGKIEHKLYYHAHNQPYHDVLCRTEIINCRNYIVVSKYIKQKYLERYANTRAHYFILKNAVNTSLFGREMSREAYIMERNKYHLTQNDIVVLFTGRITEEKGILKLAEAFLHIDNPLVKLIIAGSSFFDTDIKTPFQTQLYKILTPCINRVIFTGYLKYSEIWKLYTIADIGCFPSLANEAAPLTGIEAMAAGLPFITTNSGGIPEYAKPDCAFILERDADLSANIKQAIETLARDSNLRKAMGEKGREISAEYNLDNYYRNFVDIVSW